MRKTLNQLKTIQISRMVDEINGVKLEKKTNKYKDPNYQAKYYLSNRERLRQYKHDYHIRRKYGLS